MESIEESYPRKPLKKYEFLEERISQATSQNPFYIELKNSSLIQFDFLNGLSPKKAKVVELIKRNRRGQNPDHMVVQLGPSQDREEVGYACFPINAVKIEHGNAVIDCSAVLKEQVSTVLPNFFIEKSPN